ncbi:MAG: SDR family oxidoreductase [Hyphomonadaceae bacterium]|nr:SDR family oxidoreductase [Hyphomonadaceae bacterium]
MNAGGSILCLTYLGGEKVIPGYNLMGLCKSALESATEYLASEMGKDGIRVNCIAPGWIKTELTRPGRENRSSSPRCRRAVPDGPLGRADQHRQRLAPGAGGSGGEDPALPEARQVVRRGSRAPRVRAALLRADRRASSERRTGAHRRSSDVYGSGVRECRIGAGRSWLVHTSAAPAGCGPRSHAHVRFTSRSSPRPLP